MQDASHVPSELSHSLNGLHAPRRAVAHLGFRHHDWRGTISAVQRESQNENKNRSVHVCWSSGVHNRLAPHWCDGREKIIKF